MYKLIYKIYFYKFNNPTLDSLLNRTMVRASNILLPVWFYLTNQFKKYQLPNRKNTSRSTLIVSLTTFPARINKVWLTIETILRQEQLPDKIILWLYRGEFKDKTSLPKNLLHLEKRGLEIKFCKENLMPHKKYYYSMVNNPEASIITIDDDILYPPDLIKKLLLYHHKYMDSIISPYSRKINILNGEILLYKEWPFLKNSTGPSNNLLTLGGSGAFYPSKCLHPDVYNISDLKNLALKADDLWLKIMSIKNATKVVCIAGEYKKIFIPILRKNNVRLMDCNINNNNNDKIFQNLTKFYNIPLTTWMK